MKPFFRFVLRPKIIAALLALLCAGVAAAFLLARHRPRPESTNPNIISPVFAVEFLDKRNPKSLYYTLSAHDYLAAKKPAWVSAQNTQQALLDFYHAGQDMGLWRKLDHVSHFDAVLLCGNPSEFQPLLEGLILSPKEWMLVYLDHTSIIFQHAPAKAWTREDLKALLQKFTNYPPADRAAFLTQLASKLLAIGWADEAKQLLDESLGIDPDSPAAWTQMALCDLRRNPTQALEDTNRALKLDNNYYYALTARIRVLMFMKRSEEALHVSEHMLETEKNDPGYPGMLLYHATIAHEAHNYTEEIKTLSDLIGIVSAQKQPVAYYRVMLGQAYEKEGEAQPALDEFQKALDEGGLPDGMAQGVEMSMQSIKSQTSH